MSLGCTVLILRTDTCGWQYRVALVDNDALCHLAKVSDEGESVMNRELAHELFPFAKVYTYMSKAADAAFDLAEQTNPEYGIKMMTFSDKFYEETNERTRN